MEELTRKMDDEERAREELKKVTLEGGEGESLPQEDIKNGSRDRQILVNIYIVINRSMAANMCWVHMGLSWGTVGA